MNQKNEIEKSIIARSRQSVLVPTFKHHQYWSGCFCETTSGVKITNLSNLERNKVPLTSLSTSLFPKLTIHTQTVAMKKNGTLPSLETSYIHDNRIFRVSPLDPPPHDYRKSLRSTMLNDMDRQAHLPCPP